jgi:zinc protease
LSALERITLEDVRQFYTRHYTRANLVIGLAGGYPAGFPEKVKTDFAKFPRGTSASLNLPQPELAKGLQIEIIQRETRSTAISLGFPIQVKRGDKDWPAIALAASYLGQHRSQNSHLFQRLREARGLNYGDYAYIEYFPRGMFQFAPDPNLARRQQIFQIWIRPVEPQNGHFTLRAALYEYEKLIRDGLSKEAFEGTREFLMKYVNILTQTQDANLGYALDSRYYGIGSYGDYLREQLSKLTLEEVNAAIRRHLKSDSMRIVVITKEGEALRKAIVENKPSPISYNSPKPAEILEEDKLIQNFQINVSPSAVKVLPIENVFR